jgi:hypothetical membrane protein
MIMGGPVRTPRWTLLSAAIAPVLMIGGWTVAAALQPGGYSSITGTISALAGHAATDRWLMTAALAGVGLCHLVTALGLRPAAPAGRALLALGGLATLLVAASPLPKAGSSGAHTVAASISFGALAVWPALARRHGMGTPWGLRAGPAIAASAVLLALVGWFAAQAYGDGSLTGLTERVAAGAQALWPLLVVLGAVLSPGAADPRAAGRVSG